ncbi:hypothetical protein [Arthrobacter bambusae]|nr:hypothetical protein [Arthrobacter bambusae]MDQ0213448.1 hypothetical protein [Arthrobacter bambusae]MDQ0237748.1 hypothetical protein [Arthrobacter bambusae]
MDTSVREQAEPVTPAGDVHYLGLAHQRGDDASQRGREPAASL